MQWRSQILLKGVNLGYRSQPQRTALAVELKRILIEAGSSGDPYHDYASESTLRGAGCACGIVTRRAGLRNIRCYAPGAKVEPNLSQKTSN